MKDIKLIEAVVVSYYYGNKDIKAEKLEEILKDSLNVEIGDVTIKDKLIKICYGNKGKTVIFDTHNDKIKLKKE